MAKDHLAGDVSKPDGGFYKSSEEVRAEDAEKAATKKVAEEAVEEEAPEKKEEKSVPEPEPTVVGASPASVRIQRIRDSSKS